jgi:hypothetical protein
MDRCRVNLKAAGSSESEMKFERDAQKRLIDIEA